MREILFRGRDVDNGEWVYGDLSFVKIGTPYIRFLVKGCKELYAVRKVIPETIGQYTGLTDNNGTKIFEGDVVDILIENEEIGVVKYEDGCFCVEADDFVATFYSNFWGKDVEVIGNIHDNPELLEVE